MYKRISKTAAAVVLAAAPLATSLTPAQATIPVNSASAQIVKINGEGFRACRALGKNGFKASVSGISDDGGGGDRSAGFRYFRVNNCFETRAQCNKFLDRIHHKVPGIYKIHYIACKARS